MDVPSLHGAGNSAAPFLPMKHRFRCPRCGEVRKAYTDFADPLDFKAYNIRTLGKWVYPIRRGYVGAYQHKHGNDWVTCDYVSQDEPALHK